MTDIANLHDRLSIIREAAQVLAQRYSMIGGALMKASETFWSLIHDDDLSDMADTMKTQVNELARELTDGQDVDDRVYEVSSFAANSMIGRILDLAEEIEAARNSSVA